LNDKNVVLIHDPEDGEWKKRESLSFPWLSPFERQFSGKDEKEKSEIRDS
jgi:hypothetical protein